MTILTDLKPGDRITFLGRKGTFVGYMRMKNWPNVMEWLVDGEIDFRVDMVSASVQRLSSFDDIDDDFSKWEGELK